MPLGNGARRGTLESETAEDGKVYIWLDDDQPDGSTPTQAHLDSLEEQIALLRAELERKDHLLAAALERIPPAIESPSEARESSETASEDEGKGKPDEEDRPWWRRLFG